MRVLASKIEDNAMTNHRPLACTLAGLLLAAAACSRVEERLLERRRRALLARQRGVWTAITRTTTLRRARSTRHTDDSFMRRDWFASYLRVAKADSLSCGKPSETLRLLLMPSSRHAHIITLSFQERHWILDAVDFGDALFGGGTESPPTTLKRSTRVLSESRI